MGRGTIELHRGSGVCVIVLHGEHDASTQATIEIELKRAFAAVSMVVVDLSRVEFVDSSVLAALLYGRERAATDQQEMALVAAPGTRAARVLSILKIDEYIPVYPTRPDALCAPPQSKRHAERPAPPTVSTG